MRKQRMRAIASMLVLSLTVGLVPMSALATEEIEGAEEIQLVEVLDEAGTEENQEEVQEQEVLKENQEEILDEESTEKIQEETLKEEEEEQPVQETVVEEVSEELEEESEPVMTADVKVDSLKKNDTITGTDFHVTSLKKYTVAPDVNEKVIITNNEAGNSQTVANVMEINTKNGNAKIVAGYGTLNPLTQGWSLTRTTEQAHLYERTYGENIVGGINASLFNITSGEPMGVLAMRGTAYKEDMSWPYVAVFDDGSVGIFCGGTSLSAAERQQSEKQGQEVKLLDAIAGWVMLVDNGNVATAGSNPGYYPRTAIGLKEDGTVVMLQADGTQAPRSTGYDLEEMGRMMQALGCVVALELDEGGSSTFVSQREGETGLSLRNTPAGGAERYVSTTILIASEAAADGEFDHVSVTPDSECYTPNSQVVLNATGIDYSGALANGIPETVHWALAEGCENMGTLENVAVDGNHASVEFKSNGTLGDVTIQMLNGNNVVGSVTLHIQNPDQLFFSSDEVNLKYSEESDLGLKALYQGAPINLKAGDVEWEIGDETAGTFDGIKFIVTSEKQVSVTTDVTAKYGQLSATTTINVGKQPTVILDGGDTDRWNYSNIENTTTTFAGLAEDEVATYFYNRGAIVKGSVVYDSDEEYADIVRFGSKAIKLEYDWTNTTGTDGVCLGLGSVFEVPGTPTAIGVWVYIPENVPVPWLRAQIQTSTNNGEKWTNAYIDFTTQADTGDETVVGWQYLEADLSAYSGALIRINSGMLFRAMMTQAGIGWYTTDGVKLDKAALKGYIILDNVQIVYGANNQDVTNPKINSVQIISENGMKTELEDGATFNTNTLNLFVSYDDNESTDEFATGIESAYFYFDGNYYGEGSIDNLGSTLTGVELSNGEHSVTFYLKDGYGNVTRETRYFTVNGNDTYTNVSLSQKEAPMVGKDFQLTLNSNSAKNVSKVEASVVIPAMYPVKTVEFSDGFTGSYTYNSTKNTLKVQAEANGEQEDEVIATIVVEIPETTIEGSTINLEVSKGSYEVYDTSCAKNADAWAMGFSTSKKSVAIEAMYKIDAEIMIIGEPAVLTVTSSGEAKENVEVFLNDGTSLGKTDDKGQLSTSAITETAGDRAFYAMDEEGNRSYLVKFTCFDAHGNKNGEPYNISINMPSDLSSEKNISWMSHPTKSAEEAQIKVSLSENMKDATTYEGESTLVTYVGSQLVNRVNSVYVTGLKAETTYYYIVGDGENWSDVKSFTTKAEKDDATEIFILADIQEEDALTGFARIAEHLKAEEFDFGIQTGDAVDNVRFYNQWEDALNLFNIVSDYNMLHVVGNHEDDDDNNNAYATKEIFNLSGDWYSIEYGDVYVAVLNHVTDKEGLNEFSAWLVEDAAKSDCTWKIVTAHVPVYTTNPGGTNTLYMEIVSQAMEDAGIDFYFAGDAHSYARTAPLTDLNVDEENGVVYYISGSTGGKSYSAVDNPEYHFEKATIDFESVYLALKADFDSIEVIAYNVDTNGNKEVLDTYTKEIPYCENDEHNFVYNKATDELTCLNCPTVVLAGKELYSGFAVDSETGKNMYFISGKYLTGYVQLERDSYYFDKNGFGLEGTFEMAGETCYFEGGKFTHSDNANVVVAGWGGDDIRFVLYADATIVLEGSGQLNTTSKENVPWQKYREFIKKVVFDADITYITDYAFYDCDALTTIEFQEGSKMEIIGGAAFFSCGVLKEVVLPEGVTTIYGNAFASCNALTSVYLPDSISYMSSVAFKSSPNITLSVAPLSYAKDFAVKNGIVYVERVPVEVATGKCGANLTWTLSSAGVLVISGIGEMDSYSSINAVPWNDYRGMIKEVQIASTVTTLSDYAFANCTKLSKVYFSNGSEMTTIYGSVFLGCSSLYAIKLPEKVETIYGNSFAKCSNLTSVYLPDGITYLSSSIFRNSSKVLLSVAPDSYAKIYAEKNNLNYLERKVVEVATGSCGTNLTWTLSSNGVLEIKGNGAMTTFKSSVSTPWNEYKESIETVIIGKGVTILADYAFCGCTNLSLVEFEEESKLVMIGGSVFYGCSELREIALPEGVTTIYGNTFANCKALISVYLPESISYMSSNVYKNASKVSLSVGYDSYAKEYAVKNNIKYTERKVVELESGNCGAYLTWRLTSDGVLDINGIGKMDSYSTIESVPWNGYRNVIKTVNIGAGVTTIADYAFYRCENLSEVNFAVGSSLISVGGSAFYRCNSLASVVLPKTVETIYGNAFAKCENLVTVEIPSTVKHVSSAAFIGSNKLTKNK